MAKKTIDSDNENDDKLEELLEEFNSGKGVATGNTEGAHFYSDVPDGIRSLDLDGNGENRLFDSQYILVDKKRENELIKILEEEKFKRYKFEKEMNSFYGTFKATVRYHLSKKNDHGTSMEVIMTEKLQRIDRGINTLSDISEDLNKKQTNLANARDRNLKCQGDAYLSAEEHAKLREEYGKKLDTLERALKDPDVPRLKRIEIRRAMIKAERIYRNSTITWSTKELEGYLRGNANTKYEDSARFLDGVRFGTGIILTYARILSEVMNTLKPMIDSLPQTSRQQLNISRDFERIQLHMRDYHKSVAKLSNYVNNVTRREVGYEGGRHALR